MSIAEKKNSSIPFQSSENMNKSTSLRLNHFLSIISSPVFSIRVKFSGTGRRESCTLAFIINCFILSTFPNAGKCKAVYNWSYSSALVNTGEKSKLEANSGRMTAK
jgi:hypothetical protein